MIIEKATHIQLNDILAIYDRARSFMSSVGNPLQWKGGYPHKEQLEADISAGNLYICYTDDASPDIAAVFFYKFGNDKTYNDIYDGSWLNDEPYGVVHRIASSGVIKGAASFSILWALEQAGNIRIDTHADNIPMQSLLNKLGFTRCGIIYVYPDSTGKRIAFQKSTTQSDND